MFKQLKEDESDKEDEEDQEEDDNIDNPHEEGDTKVQEEYDVDEFNLS